MSEMKTCPKCGAELPVDAPGGICPQCLIKAGLASQQHAGSRPELNPTTSSPRFIPPEPADLAKHFPQLEILELLGKGGMGAVYKARQPGLDRLVAVKILPPEIGADPAFAERFTREARALAKLNHQNIVSVFEIGQADGLYFFVMEFVDGANLRDVLQAGSIKPEEALAIVPQICSALQFAHNEGIVHRDIKPENILIDKQGRVKIADFGLAKLLGKAAEEFRLTDTHQAMGTLHYMAPEQMQGAGAVDHRADIYSLGVVFYELLTGELPIGRFEPPSNKVHVNVSLDEVVLRSLESNPERRYQSADDFKTDVESVAHGRVDKHSNSINSYHLVRTRLKAPATGLRLAGVINCSFGLLGLVIFDLLGLVTMGSMTWGVQELIITAVGVVIGILQIVASTKMFKLRSYGLIQTVAIIGLLPCALGSLISLPFGIWVLIALSRRETIEAFGLPVEDKIKPVAPTEAAFNRLQPPRYSRKAIIGAFWTPLFFIMVLGFFWITPVTGSHADASGSSGQALWQWLLAVTLLPLGLAAPFGTTILGGIAISNIRHSRGQLIGLPLAVANVLLFPLLVFDGLVFLLIAYGLGGSIAGNLENNRMIIVLAILIVAFADFFIARAVWRIASKGMEPAITAGRTTLEP